MRRWFREGRAEPLALSMSGVKLGDRVLLVGAGDVALLTGVALKTGLTGRTCVVDEHEGRSTSAAADAEREGALVESFAGPWHALPFNDGVFDLVIVRGVLPKLDPSARVACLREILRVLRPGGRCLAIDSSSRGMAALLGRRPAERAYAAQGGAARALQAQGFRAVRTLAEREGRVFVEGVRENAPVT